jgi:Arc/MetJ-type ribon-helix-helix transcriptional regulator
MAEVHELRPKTPDSEKITVNLGFIDLGRMDLMVRDGFYANRADFIRTAVRNQLERHDDAVRQSVARRQLKLGLSHYTRQDLERRAMPGHRCLSRFSASPRSPAMSRLNSPAPPSHPCRSSAPFRPARP